MNAFVFWKIIMTKTYFFWQMMKSLLISNDQKMKWQLVLMFQYVTMFPDSNVKHFNPIGPHEYLFLYSHFSLMKQIYHIHFFGMVVIAYGLCVKPKKVSTWAVHRLQNPNRRIFFFFSMTHLSILFLN